MTHPTARPNVKNWFLQLPVALIYTVSLLLIMMFCNLPTDPRNASNSDVSLQLKSSKDRDFSNNIYDSAGVSIGIRMNLKYPEFIKSIKLRIVDTTVNITYLDTTIIPISKLAMDTYTRDFQLKQTGYQLFIVTATIDDGTNRSDTATCTVLGSTGSLTENHAPHLSINDVNRTVIAGDLCTLSVTVSDEDPGQAYTVIVSQKAQTVTLQGNQYIWRVPADAIREEKLLFIVTDNGNPPLSNSRTVTLPVSYKTPQPPANLRVTSRDEKGLTLSWNGSPRATYYAVYKAENKTGEFTLYLDSLTALSFTDKNYTENSIYYVKACNDAGTSVPTLKTEGVEQTKPTLIITSPTPYSEGMRVTSANGTVTFTANNENGIDSTYYTINSGKKINITGVNGTYSFLYSLQQSGLATITVVVVDASNKHNKSSASIIVNYNATLPPTISLGTPVNNADGIAVLAPFTWTALSDADNDSIYYRVEYSTLSDVSNSTLSPEITTDNWTIGSNDVLSNETRYYYRVIGYTKTPYQDTVKSGIRSFITEKKRVWVVTNTTLTDPDGNTYTTVTIGSQVWTVENLGTTKYNDGTVIPHMPDTAAWANLSTPAYCFYDNKTDASYQKKWGALYNWYVVNPANPKKIAPEGWHIPSGAEWDTLENYLAANGYNWDSMTVYKKIAKSLAAKTDWITESDIAGKIGNDLTINNSSGFSALPGGYRNRGGTFYDQSGYGHWWSATDYFPGIAWNRSLAYSSFYLSRSNSYKSYGLSVRLVRN